MTRDYKRKTRRRKRKTKQASGFAWLLAGFALGLGVAITVYWFTRPPIGERAASEPVPMAVAEPQSATEPPTAQVPPPDTDESRFDFYRMLPNTEVVVADVDESTPATRRRPAKKNAAYLLQAGSFQQMRDADRRKAEIALLGVESRIHTVTIGEDQVWHRVLIGPGNDMDEMIRYRTRLREADIDVLLLEVTE